MRLSFNIFWPIWIIFGVLMILGTVPFTPAAVVALVVLSHIEITFTWSRS